MRLCCLLLLAALMTAGCGLKGPLYLPNDKPETDSNKTGAAQCTPSTQPRC
jgi:predicted small lipoprotein YifL